VGRFSPSKAGFQWAEGAAVIELLDDVFETLATCLRPRGAQILKFLGDGMLAIFPFENVRPQETCRQGLDAAVEAMREIDRMNLMRRAACLRLSIWPYI
jgi:adenylate cyclase